MKEAKTKIFYRGVPVELTKEQKERLKESDRLTRDGKRFAKIYRG